jgi:hypothetical protein
VVCLDLNSKEKIKRKEIRNSKEKGKAKPAQPQPFSSARSSLRSYARPRPPSDRRAPHVRANQRSRASASSLPLPGEADLSAPLPSASRVLPLSAPQARPVSAITRSLRVPSLSRCAVGPSCQLRPLREPPLTSVHACREPRPCRLPMPLDPF